jgi:hypothetical protein
LITLCAARFVSGQSVGLSKIGKYHSKRTSWLQDFTVYGRVYECLKLKNLVNALYLFLVLQRHRLTNRSIITSKNKSCAQVTFRTKVVHEQLLFFPSPTTTTTTSQELSEQKDDAFYKYYVYESTTTMNLGLHSISNRQTSLSR